MTIIKPTSEEVRKALDLRDRYQEKIDDIDEELDYQGMQPVKELQVILEYLCHKGIGSAIVTNESVKVGNGEDGPVIHIHGDSLVVNLVGTPSHCSEDTGALKAVARLLKTRLAKKGWQYKGAM